MGVSPMTISKNWETLIADLNRMTQDGRLNWSRMEPPTNLKSGAEVSDFFYFTKYQGKKIGIYRETYKDYSGEHDEWYMANRIAIGFFDNQNRLEYLLPYDIQGAYDLLDAVMFQTARIDSFLEAWAKDQKDK
jgi:hypothetical protein